MKLAQENCRKERVCIGNMGKRKKGFLASVGSGIGRAGLFLREWGASTLTRLGRFLFARQRKVQAFFESAVRVYALRGEEDAKCAALAAAKMAGRKQRQGMIEQLSKMSSNVLQHYPDKLLRKPIAERILFLKEDLASQQLSPENGREEKGKLQEANAEYLACLERGDPSVFARRHPKLF